MAALSLGFGVAVVDLRDVGWVDVKAFLEVLEHTAEQVIVLIDKGAGFFDRVDMGLWNEVCGLEIERG